ncbi:unnamed protein product [Leuciscus chuanchicus]
MDPGVCDSLWLDCLRKVAFREASLELTHSLSDPSHPSQSRACRTWAKDPRKQLSMPPLERTKEPIEEFEIKVWPFAVCIIHHTNRGEGSPVLVRQAYSMESKRLDGRYARLSYAQKKKHTLKEQEHLRLLY